jgi:serine/threonine-protein kinase
MSLDGDRTKRPLLNSPFDESAPRFSPDGRWIAYVSNESGRTEVYVRSVGDPVREQAVSNNGGTEPVWARSGRELFYREGNKMVAVSLAVSGADLRVAGRQALFEAEFAKSTIDAANYDVTPDDQRFVMIRADEASTQTSLHVLINWVGAVATMLSSQTR